MKKRILWLGLSFLLVAALVLASCGEAVPGEQEEEEEEEEEEEGGPQYGGTLTWFTYDSVCMPQSWDLADIYWMSSITNHQYLENLLQGDVLTLGPRGTNEYSFQWLAFVPENFLKGQLAESWTVTPEVITFKIRQGIMWHESPIMEARELTADDIVHSLNRLFEAFGGGSSRAFMVDYGIDSIYAPDRYTVVIPTNEYSAAWPVRIATGFQNGIQPPELADAGADDWRNHVGIGTGAFLLESYVDGLEAIYVPNPDWWDKTKIINGKEYDTPFIDKLVYPFIADESSAIAALRTGKIDWTQSFAPRYKATLQDTSPDLIMIPILSTNQDVIAFKNDHAPFDDVNVRRALMIGTDLKAVGANIYGDYLLHAWPIGPAVTAAYTPLEELPLSAQELYEYDPAKAIQMLDDAGFPDGFEMDLLVAVDVQNRVDYASMVKAMWEDIGITVNLVEAERAVYAAQTTATAESGCSYSDSFTGGVGSGNPLGSIGSLAERPWNRYHVNDDYVFEQYTLATQELDLSKRNAILKDVVVYVLEQAMVVPGPAMYANLAYWPWVKNYYGELETGFFDYVPMQSTLWIDQDMKADLGY